ncbi:MAG: chloride channel protein, partial [Thermoproteus sp.]
MNYAIKWLLYGVIIGVVAGLSALLFHFTVSLIADVFASITGFSPTSPNVHGVRYWLTPIAVAAGAFASGLLVYTFVGSSEELGINAMIEAYHKRRGEVGVKVPILGWLASALTIGFGGSVGSEAPMA